MVCFVANDKVSKEKFRSYSDFNCCFYSFRRKQFLVFISSDRAAKFLYIAIVGHVTLKRCFAVIKQYLFLETIVGKQHIVNANTKTSGTFSIRQHSQSIWNYFGSITAFFFNNELASFILCLYVFTVVETLSHCLNMYVHGVHKRSWCLIIYKILKM